MGMAHPPAIDRGLHDALASHVTALPVPLRRFCEYHQTENLVEAVERGCEMLLKEYSTKYRDLTRRVSVGWLCDAAGVRVNGVPSKVRAYWRDTAARNLRRSRTRIDFGDSQPTIYLDSALPRELARVEIAHELGHWVIYNRNGIPDRKLLRLETSAQEEAVAEYIARCLLMPSKQKNVGGGETNESVRCMLQAGIAAVPIYCSAARRGDPDQKTDRIDGAILWGLKRRPKLGEALADAMTPYWHLCGAEFVPIGRCRARYGSLVERLATLGDEEVSDRHDEEVAIGTLRGNFVVDGFAWGSVRRGTRLVLTIFQKEATKLASFGEGESGELHLTPVKGQKTREQNGLPGQ
jgi:hypothetical protein